MVTVKESESRLVMSDSLWPHGLYSPWNSPGHNTGGDSLSLLQGIFPTQESNPGLLHCRWILYQRSHKGNPSPCKNLLSLFIHLTMDWASALFPVILLLEIVLLGIVLYIPAGILMQLFFQGVSVHVELLGHWVSTPSNLLDNAKLGVVTKWIILIYSATRNVLVLQWF